MRIGAIGLVLVAVATASHPISAKRCRLPTTESLAGTWVAADDSFNYRVLIQPDGHGKRGIRDLTGTSYVYRFDSVSFNDYDLFMTAESTTGSTDPLIIRGSAPCSRPEIRFTFFRYKAKVRLKREAEWQEAQDGLRQAIEKNAE